MTDQQQAVPPTQAPDRARPTIDVAEAAALLGVSPWLVLQQIAQGNLPHKRFGRRILVPRARFLACVDEGARVSRVAGSTGTADVGQ
jgi:excisionase family DNA binding protein